MRILHTSDLHLNSAMNTRLSAEKARERRKELLSNFGKITEYAKREKCSAIIIAGDLFDSERPSQTAKKYVLDTIENSPDLLYFYLPGNHEKRVIEAENVLPKNLFIFGSEWTGFSVGSVSIYGRSTTSCDMFEALTPPKGHTVIAVLHGELRDRCQEGGIIGKRELEGAEISYLALGHYHSYKSEKIGSTLAVYSGSPESRGFDEAGEKGFVIIDTDHDLNHKFVHGFGRGMHTVSVEYEAGLSTAELEGFILKKVADIPKSDLVRVRLVGHRSPEDKYDVFIIEKRLRDKFYYFEIKDDTTLAIRAEDYARDKSLKGEFIRLVLADDGLDDKEKDKIISAGLLALMGEKLDD